MSIDVQMFVLCNHILNVSELNNPNTAPILSRRLEPNSKLKTGTYYVANTFVNKHGVETNIGPVSKLYINAGEMLLIDTDNYVNNGEITTKNIYVGFTDQNLTNANLTKVQVEKENETIKTIRFQDNILKGIFEFSEHLLMTRLKPDKNATNLASYAERTDACPRCYGKGYYFDIFFDKRGIAVTATKSQKLLQECLKVLIEERLGNKFHPKWGCDVKQRVGKKNLGNIELFKVELAVRDAIDHLRNLQLNNQILYMNMHEEEIIHSIEKIGVKKDGPTGYNVDIVLASNVGEVITYTIKL